MSFYDDASLVFLAGGAAGKVGKIYNLKPVEEFSSTEVVINGGFSIDGPGTDGELDTSYGNYGWNTVSPSAGTQEGTTTISNGVLKLTNALGETDSRAYATDGVSSRNVITTNTYYKLVYTIVENNGCTSFKIYNAGGVQEDAPSSVGTHTVTLRNTSNQLFLFFNKTESSSISIDNVSIREITNQAADFTLNRGANIAATRVGKDGYIEKGRENLFLRSNQFDTSPWTFNGTITGGQTGYDGSSDAWLISNNITTGPLGQTISYSGVQTLSAYFKKNPTYGIRLYIYGTVNTWTWFDLNTGEIEGSGGNYIASSIEAVGDDWWRCSMTFDTTTISPRFYVTNNAGTQVLGNVTIQDAQLEYGLVATDYIETGATTATAGLLEDEPRFDYTGGGCPALLLEPARTNLVSNSEGIIGGSNAVTTTLNYGVAPDGATSSLKVQKNGTSANERIIVSDDLAVLDASTYTVSGFVKNIDIADTGVTTIGARVNAGTLFRQGYEWTGSSLASTSYASSGSTSNTVLEDYGNGWWRIGFTFTTDGTQLDFEIDIDRQNAVHTTSIETWGWQLEAGSNATSYIPTYGSSATRATDSITQLTAPDVNTDAYTFFVHDFHDLETSSNRGCRMKGASNNALMGYYTNAGDKYFFCYTNDGSGTPAFINYNAGALTEAKYAYVIDNTSNTAKLFLNGSLVASGTTSVAVEADTITFGAGAGSPNRIPQVIYFPTALSNNDSEILTGATSYSSFATMATSTDLNYTIYE